MFIKVSKDVINIFSLALQHLGQRTAERYAESGSRTRRPVRDPD
jgi:hypothetical protein